MIWEIPFLIGHTDTLRHEKNASDESCDDNTVVWLSIIPTGCSTVKLSLSWRLAVHKMMQESPSGGQEVEYQVWMCTFLPDLLATYYVMEHFRYNV